MSFCGLASLTHKILVAGSLVAVGITSGIIINIQLTRRARDGEEVGSAMLGVAQAVCGATIMFGALKLHLFLKRRQPRNLPALENLHASHIKRTESLEEIAQDMAFDVSPASPSKEDSIWKHRPLANKELYAKMKASLFGADKLKVLEAHCATIQHFSEPEGNEILALFCSEEQAADAFKLIEPKIMSRSENRRFGNMMSATMETDMTELRDAPKIRLISTNGDEETLDVGGTDDATPRKPVRSRKVLHTERSGFPIEDVRGRENAPKIRLFNTEGDAETLDFGGTDDATPEKIASPNKVMNGQHSGSTLPSACPTGSSPTARRKARAARPAPAEGAESNDVSPGKRKEKRAVTTDFSTSAGGAESNDVSPGKKKMAGAVTSDFSMPTRSDAKTRKRMARANSMAGKQSSPRTDVTTKIGKLRGNNE